jgi:hypothetical protein
MFGPGGARFVPFRTLETGREVHERFIEFSVARVG